ncbi:MAG TPA: hypothetical protein DGT21_24680 [Armatimonadetes bacterium]|jgi:putative sterol carrier protein|nr:hypothetical protein [Armatimonadota bacterium]
MSAPIRIFADRSKDAREGMIFDDLKPSVTERPGERFACTDNRLPLTEALLADYDVLTICGSSLKSYSPEELSLIEGFVADGGGLLLAADTAAFEFEANQSVEAMAQNAVARLFGAEFLTADCEGAVAHGSLLLHRPSRLVSTRAHEATGNHAIELVEAERAHGPIRVPARAAILAEYRRSAESIAAAWRVGRGRVVMCGSVGFATERPFVSAAVANWLAAGKRSGARDVEVPVFVGRRGAADRNGDIHLGIADACKGRLDEARRLLETLQAAAKERFGKAYQKPGYIELSDSITSSPWQHWRTPDLGGQAPEASLARHIAARLVQHGLKSAIAYGVLADVLSRATWETELVARLLEDAGYAEEAQRCRERADRWIAGMDRRQKTFDLAQAYEATDQQCPRGLVVFREFLTEFGDDIVRRLGDVIPEKDAHKHLPPTYAWGSDGGIYSLSVATGTDLFPWFSQRGYTVHPLPAVKPTAKNAKRRMLERLNEALRDEAEGLSARFAAANDLVSMGQEKDWLPHGRKSADDFTRLCLGLRLATEGDRRAARLLRGLFADSKPAPLRAMAGVALADLGDASVADDLIALAREFEPRFQLLAGYALEKAGSERAAELSLPRITGPGGKPVGKLDIVFDGYIAMHGEVEGYRVCNNYSFPELQRFTRHATISCHYVHWVHTSTHWRRRGLSRLAFEAAMNHPGATKCSVSMLHTGTRNVAHTLYREYGFTDMTVQERWRVDLPGAGRTDVPTGVSFRAVTDDDTPRVHAFAAQALADALLPPEQSMIGSLPPHGLGFIAERDGAVVGFAAATYGGGDDAYLDTVLTPAPPTQTGNAGAAKAEEKPQNVEIAACLLSLLQRAAYDAGARHMVWRSRGENEIARQAAQRLGYSSERTQGVWMMQVRHLVQCLGEIAPAIEHRLAGSKFQGWEGSIDLLGGRLQGRVNVAGGRVSASRIGSRPADIVLQCDDDTLTRVVLGRETPFEAYLQTRLVIAPRVSSRVVELLETVFPKVLCL